MAAESQGEPAAELTTVSAAVHHQIGLPAMDGTFGPTTFGRGQEH